jgi:hypothetical protein
LAARASISDSAVSKLENDPAANPELYTLLGLQSAFGLTSIEEVLGPSEQIRLPSKVLAESLADQESEAV